MPLLLQRRVYRADLRANPKTLYVFGDNERRVGYGGQAAEMRDEPNAVGVATLKAPGVFWTEDDAERQCAVIDRDFKPAETALLIGGIVVFPLDGIGTGLAALEAHSPTTFRHLLSRVAELKRIGGQ
jgi:hypothetical protein